MKIADRKMHQSSISGPVSVQKTSDKIPGKSDEFLQGIRKVSRNATGNDPIPERQQSDNGKSADSLLPFVLFCPFSLHSLKL